MLLLAAVYFIAGKLGLTLAIVHPSASTVWAPTGIAIAAFLLGGWQLWPAVFAAAFLVNLTTAGSAATSLGIAAGNTLEPLLAAYLVRRFANGRNAFDRPQDTFRFAFLAGILCTAVSATFGVTSLALGGYALWHSYGQIWLTWWLGDMGGALVVAPLILLWAARREAPAWTPGQALEAVALVVSLIVVGLVVFSPAFPGGARGYPLAFLCMPLLVWAAFRFDLRFASVVVLVLAITAVIGITRSTGMDAGWDLNQRLLVLQLFLGVAAVKTLALAAMVEERRRVESAVLASSEELQEAMTELEAFHRSISHDLRSPVGAVINYSAVIEEDFGGRLDDEGLRLLRRIRASAGSAANLLDQLVQFGWARSNRVERHPVDMTSIARDVQSEILASGVDAGNVKFELQVLPPAWGSAELLRCVFRNLFSNALKFSGGRRVRHIQVSGRAGAVENTYSVSDNGVGFDPGLGLTMFKPFIRGRETGGTEGSGLGLAIVARIVEKHRGRVWAESDGSSGAQVCFTLPSARID